MVEECPELEPWRPRGGRVGGVEAERISYCIVLPVLNPMSYDGA